MWMKKVTTVNLSVAPAKHLLKLLLIFGGLVKTTHTPHLISEAEQILQSRGMLATPHEGLDD